MGLLASLADPPKSKIEVAPCPTCGNPILWLDIYNPSIAAAHCQNCDPPPAPAMIHSRILIFREPPGFAWIDYGSARREHETDLTQRDSQSLRIDPAVSQSLSGALPVSEEAAAADDWQPALGDWFESLPEIA